MVIPVMDHIDKHLATAALSDDYPLALKAALAIGKKTLNRYYKKTDDAEVYRIVMGIFLYSVFIFIRLINYIISAQFFTLNTSSSTSRTPDGARHGLIQPEALSLRSTSGLTHRGTSSQTMK